MSKFKHKQKGFSAIVLLLVGLGTIVLVVGIFYITNNKEYANRAENQMDLERGSEALKQESDPEKKFNAISKECIQTTEPYTDYDVHVYDKNTQHPLQAITDVSKDQIKLNIRYDVNGDEFMSEGESVTFYLPEDVKNFATMRPLPFEANQTYTFVAEAFSFQEDQIALVSVTNMKQNKFLMDTFRIHYSYDINIAGDHKKFTDVYVITPDDYLYKDFYSFEGDIGGGDYSGEHFTPVCYDDFTNSMFVQKDSNPNDNDAEYIRVTFTDGALNYVDYGQIPCLEKVLDILSLQDLEKSWGSY